MGVVQGERNGRVAMMWERTPGSVDGKCCGLWKVQRGGRDPLDVLKMATETERRPRLRGPLERGHVRSGNIAAHLSLPPVDRLEAGPHEAQHDGLGATGTLHV